MRVVCDIKSVGQCFGLVGRVRYLRADGKPGRVLATSNRVRPYGHEQGALRDAEELVCEQGWKTASAA